MTKALSDPGLERKGLMQSGMTPSKDLMIAPRQEETGIDPEQGVPRRTWWLRLTEHIPQGQLVRYLIVGIWNTIFGYSTFAAINWLLYRRGIPASYIYAQVISNFINITVAFLGYKFFVFKTQGNFLNEWLKAMAVYWSGFLPGIILLPALVKLLQYGLHVPISRAPYIASAVLIVFGTVYSFLGHKNVTFRQKSAT